MSQPQTMSQSQFVRPLDIGPRVYQDGYSSAIPSDQFQHARRSAVYAQGMQPKDHRTLRAILFIGMGVFWTMVGLAAWFCVQWNAQMGSFPKFWTLDFYKNLKLELKMWHNLESKYRGTYGKFNGAYSKEGDPSRQLLMLSSGNAVVIQLKQDDIEIRDVIHITWDDRHKGKETKEETHTIELVDEDGDTSKRIRTSDDNKESTYFPSELTKIQLTQLKAATHPDLTEDNKLLIQKL